MIQFQSVVPLGIMFAAAWILLFPLVLLHQGSAQLLDPHCTTKIAQARDTPWMAKIIIDSKQCTGTLINNQHVITAASCLKYHSLAVVRLGDFTNPLKELRIFEDFYVQRAIVHYLYNPKTYLNNIALLRLERKVDYKPHIRPICLSLSAKTMERTQNVKYYSAFLFGNKNEGPLRISIQRQHPNHCEDRFWFAPRNTQICGTSTNQTTCEETGSPLVKKMTINGNSHHRLLAINGYGSMDTCVYTIILSYLDWIVENILDVEIFIPGMKK